jgi:SAM-dependent methyltransferase
MEQALAKPGGLMYDGLRFAEQHPYLGGNTVEGDPFTYSPSVWDYVIGRFAIQSVLDLGSGLGYASEYFHRKGLRVLAVDGMEENVRDSIYPTLQLDITKERINCKVDLVHCQEVVEHIGEEYLDQLLDALSTGKIILMTNALPNQGGHHHVNEQSTDYWIQHLRRYDCHLLVEDTHRIRRLAQADGAQYLATTGILLANRKRF